MENKKLVSIIVPVYKVEKFIHKCVNSILNQTYKKIEIILVDDGSPDNCGKICDEYAKKDNRIRVIHQENGGLSSARNTGLSVAKGEYVLFVDSDDWISMNAVEDLVKTMSENGCDMVIFEYINVFPDGRMERKKPVCEKQVLEVEEAIRLLLKDTQITNHAWRKFYKRSLLKENLFPVGKSYEDIFVAADLIMKCKKIVYLNNAYYYYYQNNAGIVKTINFKNCSGYYEGQKYSHSAILEKYPHLKFEVYASKFCSSVSVENDLKKVKDKPEEAKKLRKEVLEEMRKLPKEIKAYLPRAYKLAYPLLKLSKSIYNIYIENLSKVVRLKLRITEIKDTFLFVKKVAKIKSPKFFVFGTPTYGNLGDRALELGEEIFVEKYFPEYKMISVPLGTFNNLMFNLLKKIIRKEDYLALQAGGNIGTLYPGMHEEQELVIEKFKNYPFFIFPQTFYYSEDEFGKEVLQKTQKIYSDCKDLMICLRERKSYNFVKENFENVKKLLVPDMVLNFSKYEKNFERQGALMCLREDSEATIEYEDYMKLSNCIQERFERITAIDTHVYYDLSETEAKEQIEILLDKIASSEIFITDRLHGMIFAAITNTPCVCVLSKSHKIKGVYEWIKHLNYIELVEDIEKIQEAIEKVLSIENPEYSNEKVEQEYEKFAEKLKEFNFYNRTK